MNPLKAIGLSILIAAAVVYASDGTVVERNGGTPDVGTIEQWGITWTFDKPLSQTGSPGTYRYGRFVNGDFWILGPVTITAINPPKTTIQQDGKSFIVDGSMINPSELSEGPNASNSKQAFDSRVPFWDEDLCATPPIRLSGLQSLISTKSWRIDDSGVRIVGNQPNPAIRTAAVLTCVPAIPDTNAFRPAYCGSSTKIMHNTEDMNLSILPSLSATSGVPNLNDPKGWESWSNYLRRPWLDIPTAWSTSTLHPSENMPDYGRQMAAQINDIALLLMLNSNWITPEQKRTLAIQMIQLGIDFYGIIANGGGWGHIGGGIGQGRKLPILFAGMALDYAPYMNIGLTHGYDPDPARCHLYFMEDAQKFYTTQADIDRYGTPDKRVTRTNCRVDASDPTVIIDDSGQNWFIADDGTSEILARALQSNFDYWLVWNYEGGREEYVRIIGVNTDNIGTDKMKLRDPVTPGSGKTARVQLYPLGRVGMPDWAGGGSGDHWTQPTSDWYSRNYRMVATGNSLAGVQLFALAVKTRNGSRTMKDLWNWPAFFDYMDSYMLQSHTHPLHRSWSNFAASMWDAHRTTFGPVWKPETSANTFTLTAVCKNGQITVSPRKDRYALGEVTVSVVPSAGYSFVAWAGDIQKTDNPVKISMNGHKAIAAIVAKQDPIVHIKGPIKFTSTNQYQYVSLFEANLNMGSIVMKATPANKTGKQFLFGHTTGNWNNRIQLYHSNGDFCLGLGNSGTLKTKILALQPQTEYNIALVWNNPNCWIYVDGDQKWSGTYSGLSQVNTFADIGNTGNPSARTEGFVGTIENIRIYNRALAPDEINQTVKTLQAPENWLIEDTLVPLDLAGNPVSFSSVVSGLPRNAFFDSVTNTFSWRPWYDQAGNYELLFSAVGSDFTQKVTINVEDVLLKAWYQDWLASNGVQSAMVEY